LGDDIFGALETKIEGLILKIQAFKQEKNDLELHIEEQKGKIQALESENVQLKEENQQIRNNYENRQKKLDAAANKIQSLLSKLEAVE
jgi:predicted nuclease with TOPRIM domain